MSAETIYTTLAVCWTLVGTGLGVVGGAIVRQAILGRR